MCTPFFFRPMKSIKNLRLYPIGVEIFNAYKKKFPRSIISDTSRTFAVIRNFKEFSRYQEFLVKHLNKEVIHGSSEEYPSRFPCAVHSFILGTKKLNKSLDVIYEGYLIHAPFTHVDGIIIAQATRKRT